jgi:hypothetical protein
MLASAIAEPVPESRKCHLAGTWLSTPATSCNLTFSNRTSCEIAITRIVKVIPTADPQCPGDLGSLIVKFSDILTALSCGDLAPLRRVERCDPLQQLTHVLSDTQTGIEAQGLFQLEFRLVLLADGEVDGCRM